MTSDEVMALAIKCGIEIYPAPYNCVRLCTLDNLVELVNRAIAQAQKEK